MQVQEITEDNKDDFLILRRAIDRMLDEEKKRNRGASIGTLMTIGDIKKVILPNYPVVGNTFRKAKTIPNYSDEKVIKGKKSIFLAGPTPRDKSTISWREEALLRLSQLGFDGVVYIPEFSTMKPKEDYVDQAMWEREALIEASAVLFWIPRDLETMPAFTTNVEFGYWISKKRITYGRPDNAPKIKYLDWLYAIEYGESPFNNLDDLLRSGCEIAQEIKDKEYVEDATERFRQKLLNGEFTRPIEPCSNPITEEEYSKEKEERDTQAVKKFVKSDLFQHIKDMK